MMDRPRPLDGSYTDDAQAPQGRAAGQSRGFFFWVVSLRAIELHRYHGFPAEVLRGGEKGHFCLYDGAYRLAFYGNEIPRSEGVGSRRKERALSPRNYETGNLWLFLFHFFPYFPCYPSRSVFLPSPLHLCISFTAQMTIPIPFSYL